MSKHTPGPWEVTEDGDIQANGGLDFVARIYNSDDFPCIEDDAVDAIDAEADANARLIAAAPDLLEALQTTAGNIRSLGPSGALPEPYTVWLSVVENAIAKATGT